ncbi:PAS domain-containing protein [Methylibium sp. T29]|uniref:PAS domain-containing protein n=1 Tax=Methylibium sp. T29 TaxID=1430884 RepID=UPI0004B25FBB|nr:PAS domain-containing protein [Methylibium sp. T29]
MSAADAVVLWHGFLDTLNDPLLMLDAQARVRFANTAALRLFPFEPGMPLEDLLPVIDGGLVSWVLDVLEGRADELLSSFPDAALSQLSAQRWALRLPPARRERVAAAVQTAAEPLARCAGCTGTRRFLPSWKTATSASSTSTRPSSTTPAGRATASSAWTR